ncbi:TetR family transcriptional regulator [Nocardia arthritidis]|uniref:TetR family transcriptional regulator n=1 Tax=Nocardia arthritidis TaxID=228602 RepID=A0A6G9YPI9_9NOCA|nr:TetR family transcriptional regulator [Nocardia arthritidis]QIS14997.1 TetR family transcriptional regulator [Nocardia arthritidis]
MDDENHAGMRERILAVALDLFGAHGYHRTSVRAIAEQLGITKAGVLYHYPSKYDILAGLAEPLLVAMERTVATAGRAEPAVARRMVVEGLLDVYLAHRYLLRLSLSDLAMAGPGSIFERLRTAMVRANELAAGPHPTFAERVRASQIIASLGDPVVLYAEAPLDELRAEVLAGIELLYGDGPQRVSGQRGRPAALTPELVAVARRMSVDEGRSVPEIARELGVSRATLYRYLK